MTITPQGIILHDSWIYRMEYSRLLANFIHNQTGWQLTGVRVASYSEPEITFVYYMGVRTPSGAFLDARGLSNQDDFLNIVQDTNASLEYIDAKKIAGTNLKSDDGKNLEVIKKNAEDLVAWALTLKAGIPQKPQPHDTVPLPNGRTVTLNENGLIIGEISLPLDSISSKNIEGLYDAISIEFTGSNLLANAEYELIGITDVKATLKVIGDPSDIFESQFGPYGEEDDLIVFGSNRW